MERCRIEEEGHSDVLRTSFLPADLNVLVMLLRACDDARDDLANHRANAPRESIQDRVRYDLTVAKLSSSLMRKERAYKEALIKHGERDAPEER